MATLKLTENQKLYLADICGEWLESFDAHSIAPKHAEVATLVMDWVEESRRD